jgi:hypothetical protein
MRVTWPPRAVVRLSVALVLILVVLGALAWVVAGAVAALGLMFGAVVGVGAALADVGWGWRLALAAATAVSALLGGLVSDRPVLAGLVVAVAALAQVPFTVRGAKLAMMLPVVPALTASLGPADRTVAMAGWLAVGVVAVAFVARLLGVSGPPERTRIGDAAVHSVATAVVAGVGFAVARTTEVGHGYWLVVAVASVLAVSRDATGREAAERVAGTLAGAALAIALVALLPPWGAVLVAAPLLVLSVAWAVVREVTLSAGGASAAIVLLGSGGLVGAGAGLAAERLLLTLAGAALAAVTVAVLWRLGVDRAGAPQEEVE